MFLATYDGYVAVDQITLIEMQSEGDTISRVFMLTEHSSHTQKLIVRVSSDYEYRMFPV